LTSCMTIRHQSTKYASVSCSVPLHQVACCQPLWQTTFSGHGDHLTVEDGVAGDEADGEDPEEADGEEPEEEDGGDPEEVDEEE